MKGILFSWYKRCSFYLISPLFKLGEANKGYFTKLVEFFLTTGYQLYFFFQNLKLFSNRDYFIKGHLYTLFQKQNWETCNDSLVEANEQYIKILRQLFFLRLSFHLLGRISSTSKGCLLTPWSTQIMFDQL